VCNSVFSILLFYFIFRVFSPNKKQQLVQERNEIAAALTIQSRIRSNTARQEFQKRQQNLLLKQQAKEADDLAFHMTKSATKIQSLYRIKKSRERFEMKRREKASIMQKLLNDGDNEGALKLEDDLKQEDAKQRAHEQFLRAQEEV
jgi:hypothetical protein